MGGMYIYGDVKTNIEQGTEMWDRLQTINARYEREIKIREYERQIKKGWFRKPVIEKWYEVVDGYSNMVIVEMADQHGVELYLLGMINGDKMNTHGWIKRTRTPESKLAKGTIIREDLSGRQFIIESALETNDRYGYGVYLYKMINGPTPSFGLYRSEFTIVKEAPQSGLL